MLALWLPNDIDMEPLTTTAIMLIPREPFYAWLREADLKTGEDTEQLFTQDYNIYLLPDMLRKQEIRDYVNLHYLDFFQNELNQWHDQLFWPQTMDIEVFHQWFELRIHSQIFQHPKAL